MFDICKDKAARHYRATDGKEGSFIVVKGKKFVATKAEDGNLHYVMVPNYHNPHFQGSFCGDPKELELKKTTTSYTHPLLLEDEDYSSDGSHSYTSESSGGSYPRRVYSARSRSRSGGKYCGLAKGGKRCVLTSRGGRDTKNCYYNKPTQQCRKSAHALWNEPARGSRRAYDRSRSRSRSGSRRRYYYLDDDPDMRMMVRPEPEQSTVPKVLTSMAPSRQMTSSPTQGYVNQNSGPQVKTEKRGRGDVELGDGASDPFTA